LQDTWEMWEYHSLQEQIAAVLRVPTDKKEEHTFTKAQKDCIAVLGSNVSYRFRLDILNCFFEDVDRLI